jgi:hypothetical protein
MTTTSDGALWTRITNTLARACRSEPLGYAGHTVRVSYPLRPEDTPPLRDGDLLSFVNLGAKSLALLRARYPACLPHVDLFPATNHPQLRRLIVKERDAALTGAVSWRARAATGGSEWSSPETCAAWADEAEAEGVELNETLAWFDQQSSSAPEPAPVPPRAGLLAIDEARLRAILEDELCRFADRLAARLCRGIA